MEEEATVLDEEIAPEEIAEEPEAIEAADTDVESEEEAEDQAEEEPEIEEFDFGGDKLQLPKGSVPDELRDRIESFTKGTWADYTRKSQEVSEKTKVIEAREQAVEKLSNLNGEALHLYGKGVSIQDELAQLQRIDVTELWQSDPDQARQVSDMISTKQAELNRIVAEVNRKDGEITQAQREEETRRREAGKADVARRIKGFSEDTLVEYAIKSGIPEKDARDWSLNPVVTEMAWKAMQFDRMQEAPKPKPKNVQPMKPIGGSGGKAAKDISSMTPGEMARHLGLPG
jgi:hypothetical protein